jgi:hypothetical protein
MGRLSPADFHAVYGFRRPNVTPNQAQRTRPGEAHACKKARVGLSTLDPLENTRIDKLGYSKITHILTALELKLQEASAHRPTLLRREDRTHSRYDRGPLKGNARPH